MWRRDRSFLAARVISRVFDPIVLIPLTLVLAVWWALVNGERAGFLVFLLLVDGVLPGIVLFWFVTSGNVMSGWDVRDRRERVPLFFFVVVAHAVGVLSAWLLDFYVLAGYLTAFWLLTVVYAIVTLYWKISVHVGVMSALVTFVVLHLGPRWSWCYGLVLVMIWARVTGKYHKLTQAVWGGLVPLVVLPLVFFGLELV